MKFENTDIISLDLDLRIPYKKKKAIIELIALTGAKVSFILNRKSKVLVIDNKENFESYKCRTAFKLNIPVVHIDYFYKTLLEENNALKLNDYLIKDKSNDKKFKKGIVTTQRDKIHHKDFIDFKNIKHFTPENDYQLSAFESHEYQVLKWLVFHELIGNREIIVEINYNNQQYRLRFEILKNSEHQIKTYYSVNPFQIYQLFLHLTKPYLNDKFKYDKVLPNKTGSKNLQNIYFKTLVNQCDFQKDLGEFLNYIWSEAVGQLDQILSSNEKFYGLTIDRLDISELLLYKQRDEFLKPKNERTDFTNEYFNSLSFSKSYVKKSLLNRKNLNDQFELIQVLRDMINISEETNWNIRSSVKSIYRSIGCFISKLDGCDELKSKLMASLDTNMEILNLYEINRPNEILNFNKQNLDNVQLLYHGSRVTNLVGLLSRGLLNPKIILSSSDSDSSDPLEMLGFGIYFSDSLKTSLKYAKPSSCKNTRFVLICEVALGKCKEYYDFDYNLTKAPDGFDSVHGVIADGSKFEDSEFCVYDPQQCRIKYLVEIKDRKAKSKNFDYYLSNDEEELVNEINENIDVKDIKQTKTSSALKSSEGKDLPLKSVHVRAQIIDMVSKVTIYQEYENTEEESIEAEYLFPLIDTATVCNFEAFINDKHVIGVCKEKEIARREYKEAIEQGKGAYLIDQETSEIFKVNVGNLPSNSKCVIKITYVSELEIQNEEILFRLPSNICQWKLLEERDQLQDSVISRHINKIATVKRSSFKASIIMPFEIRTIKSYTHEMKIKKTQCQAVVEMGQKLNSLDDDTLILSIQISTIHMPRMFVEEHFDEEENKISRACMVSFYPEFDFNDNNSKEQLTVINFLIDCSNSLRENNLINLSKKLVLKMLDCLPKQILFNVIIFGSNYDELFPYAVLNTSENLEKSKKFIQSNIKANKGNTDLLNYIQNENTFNKNSNFILISDGHFTRPNELISFLYQYNLNRIFTCSIGNLTNNNHLLKLIANITNSHYNFYDSQNQSKWQRNIEDLMDKVQQPPAISDIKIEWQNFREPELFSENFQYCSSPNKINCLFNGRRVLVYGFIPNCQQAVLKAKINGNEFETLVSCPELMITKGDLIHKLAAKSLIDDFQNGILCHSDKIQNDLIKQNLRTKIIKLSKKFSIISEYTSFIAIEERDNLNEFKENIQIRRLLDENDRIIELLPYMEYESILIKRGDLDLNNLNENDRELLFKFYLKNEDFMESNDIRKFIALECQKRNMIKKAIQIYELCETDDEIETTVRSLKNLKQTFFIKALTGRTLIADLNNLTTVEDVKNFIEEDGIPKDQQRLIFAGKALEDNMYLSDYNIQEGSVVHLVLKLRGGPRIKIESKKKDQHKHNLRFDEFKYNISHMKLDENLENKRLTKKLKNSFEDEEVVQDRRIKNFNSNSNIRNVWLDENESQQILLIGNDENKLQTECVSANEFTKKDDLDIGFIDRNCRDETVFLKSVSDTSIECEETNWNIRSSAKSIFRSPTNSCSLIKSDRLVETNLSDLVTIRSKFQNISDEKEFKIEEPNFPSEKNYLEFDSSLSKKEEEVCDIHLSFCPNSPIYCPNSPVYCPDSPVYFPSSSPLSSSYCFSENIKNIQQKLLVIPKPTLDKTLDITDSSELRKFIKENLISKAKLLTVNDLNFFDTSQIESKFKIREKEFNLEPVIEYIISMGLNSLGENTAVEIKEMIIRLLILILFLNVINQTERFEFETLDELKNLVLTCFDLNSLNENIKIWFYDCANSVEKTLLKYPHVCDSLELSSNWNKLLLSWLKS